MKYCYIKKSIHKYSHFFLGVIVMSFWLSNKSQTETVELLTKVSTIGLFDGTIINKYGYKINDYYISISDLSDTQIEAIKGKKIKVSGQLYIRPKDNPNGFQSSGWETKYIKHQKIVLYQELDSSRVVQGHSLPSDSI